MIRIDAIRSSTTNADLDGIEWLVSTGITAPLDAEERAALALRRAEVSRDQRRK